MRKSVALACKKILLPAVLFAVLALLVGLSFLPSVRGEASSASSRAAAVDPEALRVLGCCRAYAAGHDFSAELDGCIKARVYGLPYTQAVSGNRTVSGEDFCSVTESKSAFVKAGMKKQCKSGEYSVVDGDYRNKTFVYGAPIEFSRERYIAAYGMPSVDIVRYELDGSIISAERVDGETFRFVLDARRATKYSKNEVRTILGVKSFPEYESVEFTLTTDGERPIKIASIEKFAVDKIGKTVCTAQYTETFEF